jgi:nitrite reductase (NADH) large subunit
VLGGGEARYCGSVVSTNLKVSGVAVFSAGDFIGGESSHSIVLRDDRLGTYRKLVLAGDRLIGAVLVGDTRDALWYLDLIRSGRSVSGLRNDLMFGEPGDARKAA